MLSYILVGSFILLALIIVGSNAVYKIKLVLISVILVIAAFLYFTFGVDDFLGYEQRFGGPIFREVALFFSMFAGMCARVISQAIEKSKKHSRSARLGFGALRLSASDFVYPFLASFVAFLSVLKLVGPELSLEAILIAFQNGFFWQTVIKNR